MVDLLNVLQPPSLDAFQIEWKRGDAYGMTERPFPGDDGVAVFHKQSRVDVTTYFGKRINPVCPKHVKFAVVVWRKSHRKTFGKAEVDVGQYIRVSSATTATIEIESPHSAPSHALIALATNALHTVDGQPVAAPHDMTSVADAMGLVTDQNDDWAVREAIAGDGSAKLDAFLAER